MEEKVPVVLSAGRKGGEGHGKFQKGDICVSTWWREGTPCRGSCRTKGGGWVKAPADDGGDGKVLERSPIGFFSFVFF